MKTKGTLCSLVYGIVLCLKLCSIATCTSRNCATGVTVDPTTGLDCSKLTQNLANQTCNDLQDVLLSISDNRTTHQLDGCIEVTVLPGNYTISNFVTIHQNMALNGVAPVSVTFNFTDTFDPTANQTPYYVISFVNSNYAEMKGIEFHDSPGIIALENVTNVNIDDCSFRYFFQGAVDVYNCHKVTVSNCIFEHNGPTSVLKPQQYRAHAGGLSLGYHNSVVIPEPEARVVGCVFRNNTSDPLADIVQTTTQALRSFIFTGRGGGCAFAINPAFPLNATVEDCLFEENYALSFGGGLYVAFDGFSNHTVVINRVKLLRNRTPGTAGALEVGFVQSAGESVSEFYAYNSEFVENRAFFGAGVYVFVGGPQRSDGQLSNFAHFENCTFIHNTADEFGSAIGFASLLYFQRTENVIPMEIESCKFIDNDVGRGGAVSTAYLPLRFDGDNEFEGNTGRTLVVLATRIEVHGRIGFTNNSGIGIDGGALYVTSLGQLELFSGADMVFDRNIGSLGAAIVVENHDVPDVYSSLLHNPLCVLLYENPSEKPDEWENVSVTFTGNEALVGSSVYMNNIDLCSWIQLENPFFDTERVFKWDFVDQVDNNKNTAHELDEYNPLWYIQTSAEDLQVITPNVTVFPGEEFSLFLKTTDEIHRSTAAVIRLESAGSYIFDPAVVTLDQLQASAITTSLYTLSGGGFNNSESATLETLVTELPVMAIFQPSSVRCPPGHVLSPAPIQPNLYTSCQCNQDNPDVLDCDGRRIVLQDGLWGTLGNQIEQGDDSLVTYQCPRQYCRCFSDATPDSESCNNVLNSADIDLQCNCDREGVLCGDCKDGAGVSALLNQCVSCDDAYGLLIAALITVDVVAFLGLLLLKRPFPSWLYPCIFYLQVLPFLTEYFPLTFEKLHPYLYYISSALSFYFVYDFCLYSNMSALVSYFLRYLPLFVALIVVIPVGLVREYSKKHLIRKPAYGIWWIFLLQYTHIVHTSMTILYCPTLPTRTSGDAISWFINGNVECFGGWHVPLALLAILVLVLCMAFIPLITVYSKGWLEYPLWLHRCIKPLRRGFKDEYQWWASIELGRRFLLLLFTVYFPGNEYPAIFVLAITLTVFGFLQPYEDIVANVLEAVLSLDILILLLLENTEQVADVLQVLPTQSNTTEQCTVSGVTNMSWLLFPFYYFPLVVTVIAATVLVIKYIRHHIQKRYAVANLQGQTSSLYREIRAPTIATTTYLDLDALRENRPNSTFETSLSEPPCTVSMAVMLSEPSDPENDAVIQSQPQDPENVPVIQSEPQAPENVTMMQSEPQAPENVAVIQSQPQAPENATVIQSQPQAPENVAVADSQPRAPVNDTVMQSVPTDPEGVTVMQSQPTDPEGVTVIQSQPTDPEGVTVMQSQPTDPEGVTVMQSQPTDPEGVTVMQSQPTDPEGVTVMQSQPTDPEGVTVMQSQPTDPEGVTLMQSQPTDPEGVTVMQSLPTDPEGKVIQSPDPHNETAMHAVSPDLESDTVVHSPDPESDTVSDPESITVVQSSDPGSEVVIQSQPPDTVNETVKLSEPPDVMQPPEFVRQSYAATSNTLRSSPMT